MVKTTWWNYASGREVWNLSLMRVTLERAVTSIASWKFSILCILKRCSLQSFKNIMHVKMFILCILTHLHACICVLMSMHNWEDNSWKRFSSSTINVGSRDWVLLSLWQQASLSTEQCHIILPLHTYGLCICFGRY